MSNSSAVAAARRRRAATNEVSGPQIQNTQSQNIEREQIVEEKITPLQLLKIHDDKLNEIDMGIEKIVSDYVDIKIKFHTDKIKELMEENNNLKKEIELLKSNNSSNNDEKINELKNELKNELSHYKNMLITNQDKLLEVSNTNNRVLEKINEITLATNISNEVSQEEEGISNMKSLFENLLKTQLLSDNDNDNDNDNNSDSDNDETNTSFEKHLLNIGEEPDKDLDNILPINEIKEDVESSILNMTTTNLTNEIDSFNENDNFVELPQ